MQSCNRSEEEIGLDIKFIVGCRAEANTRIIHDKTLSCFGSEIPKVHEYPFKDHHAGKQTPSSTSSTNNPPIIVIGVVSPLDVEQGLPRSRTNLTPHPQLHRTGHRAVFAVRGLRPQLDQQFPQLLPISSQPMCAHLGLSHYLITSFLFPPRCLHLAAADQLKNSILAEATANDAHSRSRVSLSVNQHLAPFTRS